MNTLVFLEMKIERQCEEDGFFYETYFHVNEDGKSFYTPLEMLETFYTIYTNPDHVPSPVDKKYVPEKHLLELMIQARRLQPFPKQIIKKSKKNLKTKIPYKSNRNTIQKVKKTVSKNQKEEKEEKEEEKEEEEKEEEEKEEEEHTMTYAEIIESINNFRV